MFQKIHLIVVAGIRMEIYYRDPDTYDGTDGTLESKTCNVYVLKTDDTLMCSLPKCIGFTISHIFTIT